MNTVKMKDYRMVRLTDGTTIMGSIVVVYIYSFLKVL